MELFHRILKTAVDGAASDVHLKIATPVVFRINRQLIAIESPHPTEEWMNKVVEGITPAHLLKRRDQEREIDFSYYVPSIGRFRTNLFQQRGQWCLAMRYVKTIVPSFEELGLLLQIQRVAESPRGIVLLAGSTGCGKSTTLAAMIEHINANFKKHIITLEDPIEYVFEDNQCVVEQREVGLDTLSFHHALKHVLRQDPDIIMIGEMRDSISFTAAMSAADTGHLVLSTLHTNTAVGALTRLRDMGIEPFLLSSSLIGVLAQRLVRVLNPETKQPFQAGEYERRLLNLRPDDPSPVLYRPGRDSGGGYRGRSGIYELIVVDDAMRTMIHDGASEQDLERHARRLTPSIRDDGRARVLRGETTIEEVLRVTRED